MKQRLAIAAALLTPRDLIILDEPTNGLDPQGTREVRALVRQIAADGITVFVSSHLLAEVEQVSTHVGVMRLGKLVFQGELAALRRTAAPRVAVRTGDVAAAAEVLAKLGLADPVAGDGLVTAELGDAPPEKVTAELVHAGVGVRGLTVEAPSLEDLFVGLTGEGFDVEREPDRRDDARPEPVADEPAADRSSRARSDYSAVLRQRARVTFFRRRNQLLLLVAALFPLLIGIGLKAAAPHGGGGRGPGSGGAAYFSQLAGNGVFLTFVALSLLLILVLPVVVAVVAGDSVAGRGRLRHAALPARGPGRADPAARGQVRHDRRLGGGRHLPRLGGRPGRRGGAVRGGPGDPAVGHDRVAGGRPGPRAVGDAVRVRGDGRARRDRPGDLHVHRARDRRDRGGDDPRGGQRGGGQHPAVRAGRPLPPDALVAVVRLAAAHARSTRPRCGTAWRRSRSTRWCSSCIAWARFTSADVTS